MVRVTAESKLTSLDRKLASMRRRGEPTNLTLICEKSLHTIYYLVLAPPSNHLTANFYTKKNGKVEIPSSIMNSDASPVDKENLIKYIRCGKVVIPENQLNGLVRLAECLKIDSLKKEHAVRINRKWDQVYFYPKVPGYFAPLNSSGKSRGKRLQRKDEKCRNLTSVPDRAGAGSSRMARRNECQDEDQFPNQTDTLNSINFEPIMSSTLLGDAINSPRPLPRRVEELKKSGAGMAANAKPSKSRRTRPCISPTAPTASTSKVSVHLGESHLERKLKGRKMHNASVSMYAPKVVAKKTGLKRDRIVEVNESVRRASKKTPANGRTTIPKVPKVKKHKTGMSRAGGADSGHRVHKFGPRNSTTPISGVEDIKGKSGPLTPYPKYLDRPLKRLQGSEKAIPIDSKMKSKVSCVAFKLPLGSTQKRCTVVQVIPKASNMILALDAGKSAESGVRSMKSCQKSERKNKISGEERMEPTKSVVGVNVALVGKKGRRPKKFNAEVDLVDSGVEKRRNYNTRASKKAGLPLATEEQ